MNFLRKILLIAVATLVIWKEDAIGVQFSDPRQGSAPVVNPGGLIPNGSYYDFQVDGSYHIYFPNDGSQPITSVAAECSCARIADTGFGTPGRSITNWYIEAFGGSNGLVSSTPAGEQAPVALNLPPLGFKDNAPHVIITHTPRCFETVRGVVCNPPRMRRFWQAFRCIASNSVGRVLLYRILIEIRRQHAGNGVCGDSLALNSSFLTLRNLCRSIEVQYVGRGNFFSCGKRKIGFDDGRANSITLRIHSDNLDTFFDPDSREIDVGVFHEMLHWLHFLRHPYRYAMSSRNQPKVYRYLLRSYYGDHHGISELYTWGAAPNDEEIRTILGAPNYNDNSHLALMDYIGTFLPDDGGGLNVAVSPLLSSSTVRYIPEADKFLEGDDLSENVYRMARERHTASGMSKHKMRFGHGDVINPVDIHLGIPNRFRLAHKVATDCYAAINGHAVTNWDLVSGEATQ